MMSLTKLKDEATRLTAKEQRELIAFLVALQTEKDHDLKRKLAAKIEDHKEGNWMELKELRSKYGR